MEGEMRGAIVDSSFLKLERTEYVQPSVGGILGRWWSGKHSILFPRVDNHCTGRICNAAVLELWSLLKA